MPELPEVQTIVDDLKNDHLIGTKIIKIDIFWQKSIEMPPPATFCKQVAGQTILDIQRRGKYILLKLKKRVMLIHLRMSGRILLDHSLAGGSHERVRFTLDDGRFLKFEDQRKFGRISLLNNPEEKLGDLGVEPLSGDFTPAYLKSALQGKTTKIKSLLLNQKIFSGIGNIYADESLWEAKIHPERACKTLSNKEMRDLHRAIQKVLKLGIVHRGTSLGSTRANFHSSTGKRGGNLSNLSVYQRQNLPCLRCNHLIVKIISSGRGTHFCPNCQI